VYVVAFRVIRGNGLKIALSLRTALWEKIKDVYFPAIQAMTAQVDEYPPRPTDYKPVTRDDFLYLLHPNVKAKEIKGIQRMVSSELKSFTKTHGKLVMDPDYHASIIVHANKEDALDISSQAAESYSGYYTDRLNRRVFAVPLGSGNEPKAYLGSALRSLFYQLRYGDNQPLWIHEGEVRASWVTNMSGRKLPALSRGYKKSIPNPVVDFQQLHTLRGVDLTNQAFCYVAFFEAGPGRYQKAFRSFLKMYGSTGDWRAATKKYLLALDQKKMAKDMARFAEKELRE
jgi:hypothetical protein